MARARFCAKISISKDRGGSGGAVTSLTSRFARSIVSLTHGLILKRSGSDLVGKTQKWNVWCPKMGSQGDPRKAAGQTFQLFKADFVTVSYSAAPFWH